MRTRWCCLEEDEELLQCDEAVHLDENRIPFFMLPPGPGGLSELLLTTHLLPQITYFVFSMVQALS